MIQSDIKNDKEKFKKDISSSPHYRNVFGNMLTKGRKPTYPDISWIIDLLPDHPRDALNVIDAFGKVHLYTLPDGRIHGLFDAQSIIRARYFDKTLDRSVLYSLSPTDFEHIVESLYHEKDYSIKMTKRSHDGGRDLIISKNDTTEKEKSVVSCKRLKGTVPIDDVRNILGVASFEKATKAILVTTSIFSEDSKKMEKSDSRLELIDFEQLQKALNKYLGANWYMKID